MKTGDVRLCFEQQRDMVGADIADLAVRLGHLAHAQRFVTGLQMPTHRLADLRRTAGVGPDRIVDVKAAAALLAKTGDPPRSLFRAARPHAKPAEPAGIGHRGGERGCAGAAHRGLQDRIFEIEPLGERVARPHDVLRTGPPYRGGRAGTIDPLPWMGEGLGEFHPVGFIRRSQCQKISSRMMIGMGMPSSHSKSPLPNLSSSAHRADFAGALFRFRYGANILPRRPVPLTSRARQLFGQRKKAAQAALSWSSGSRNLVRQKRSEVKQHALKPTSRAAWAEVVAPDLLDQLLVAVDKPIPRV